MDKLTELAITVRNSLADYFEREDAPCAIEYALFAGIIAVGVTASVGTVSDALGTAFTNMSTSIDNAM